MRDLMFYDGSPNYLLETVPLVPCDSNISERSIIRCFLEKSGISKKGPPIPVYQRMKISRSYNIILRRFEDGNQYSIHSMERF